MKEIRSVDVDEVYDTSEHETVLRKDLAAKINNSRYNSSRGGKYVLKSLRQDLPEEEHVKGIVDLAIEAEFLSVLQHDNIITMRGGSNADPHENNFFVILDRLSMTLDRKFNLWRKIVGENTGYWIPCFGYCCSKSHALHILWRERLEAAKNITAAIHHLHQQNIIYRDLKPDNVGFDSENKLKIFDFGLAKRLDKGVERSEDGNFHLTGNTGSLRYMAPEVALDQPYNFSADAYSFGILFWQICSLTTPYSGYSQKMHADKVVSKGQRPKPDLSWPASWVFLMEQCWNRDPLARPSFVTILDELSDRIDDLDEQEGVVPTRASEIRAKKRKKKVSPKNNERLDADTRTSSSVEMANSASNVKRFTNEIV